MVKGLDGTAFMPSRATQPPLTNHCARFCVTISAVRFSVCTSLELSRTFGRSGNLSTTPENPRIESLMKSVRFLFLIMILVFAILWGGVMWRNQVEQSKSRRPVVEGWYTGLAEEPKPWWQFWHKRWQ